MVSKGQKEMNDTIRRSEEIRQSAIALLLEEKSAIEEQLAKCGWENGAVPAAPKSTRVCGKCGQAGHNAKTCPQVAEPTS